MRTWAAIALVLIPLASCKSADTAPATPPPAAPPAASAAAEAPVITVSIVGTNDLHGRVHALPLLAGYVENLRAVRREDGGAVLLLDGGDMFQGTLESNLLEGTPVRDAYAAMGYDAVAVGNHEFDYGPLGEAATPASANDDPRGALRALAQDAPFPFLTSNLVRSADGERVQWTNMPAHTVVDAAGVRVGILGVSTEDTLRATHSANVTDLAMTPLAETIQEHARQLRDDGAAAVVVVAHAGGKCERFTGDFDADGCIADEEIFEVARALPEGTVDVIVAGHTHAGVAHDVHGIAIIEQFSYGRAFGRVDLRFEGSPPHLVDHTILAPQALCSLPEDFDYAACEPNAYEGAPVERVGAVRDAIASGVEAATAKRNLEIGPILTGPVLRAYDRESALGNLFADLLLESVPDADVAMVNGGGLRDDLPAGPLQYGELFLAFPFDNRVASVELSVADLEQLLAAHVGRGGGILSVAGITVRATCKAGAVHVELRRGAKRLRDTARLKVLASDFMMMGGDGFWGGVTPGEIEVHDMLVRDALQAGLAKRSTLDPSTLLVEGKPRLRLAQPRPMTCR